MDSHGPGERPCRCIASFPVLNPVFDSQIARKISGDLASPVLHFTHHSSRYGNDSRTRHFEDHTSEGDHCSQTSITKKSSNSLEIRTHKQSEIVKSDAKLKTSPVRDEKNTVDYEQFPRLCFR
jgi:hypothetical protein